MTNISTKDIDGVSKRRERNEKFFNYLFLTAALLSVVSVIAIIVFTPGLLLLEAPINIPNDMPNKLPSKMNIEL